MPQPRLRALTAAALLLVLPATSLAQAGDAQRGVKLFEERNLAEARAEFTAALARNAKDATALYYTGRIAMAEERPGEAVDWFEKAVKADDNSARGRHDDDQVGRALSARHDL
jgi:tetratricopeptide (TPR) repeat protein